MVGSSWRPSPNTSKRQRPPPRQTCALSSRSTRSGRWRLAGNCSPRSALGRKPKRHTRPLCTRSSVPSAAPSCGVWKPPTALNYREPKPGTHAQEHARQHLQDRHAPHDTAHAGPTDRGRSPAVHHTDGRNRRGAVADMQRHTAAHTPHESHTGHQRMRRQYGKQGIASSYQRP